MNKIHPELFDLKMSAEAQPLPGIDTVSCFYLGARTHTALQRRKEA